jgi:hypothetical protein
VRTANAFAPIIDENTFRLARKLLKARTINQSDGEILEALRHLRKKEGRLSLQLIKASRKTPSPSTYRKRFGSLRHAYELIAYGKSSDFGSIDLRRRTQGIREELLRRIPDSFPSEATIVRRGGRWRTLLRLTNGRIITLLISSDERLRDLAS